jgi:hypothetical protein
MKSTKTVLPLLAELTWGETALVSMATLVVILILGLLVWLGVAWWAHKKQPSTTASPEEGLQIIKITSLTFSLITWSVLSAVAVAVSPFLISYVRDGKPITSDECRFFKYGLALILIGGYLYFWKEKPKEAMGVSDYEIPDGHLGKLQFLGMPIKFLVIKEGRLWLPWGFSVTTRSVQNQILRIPEKTEDIGFLVDALSSTTRGQSKRVAMACSLSLTYKIKDLYKVIFRYANDEVLKQTLSDFVVSTIKDLCSGFNPDQLMDQGSQARRIILFGTEKDTNGVHKDESDSDGNIYKATPGAIHLITERAKEIGLCVDSKSFVIYKINYKDPKTREALEASTRVIGEINAKQAKIEAIKKRMDGLKKDFPKMTDEQIREQANLEFEIQTKQTIETTAGTQLLVGTAGGTSK